MATEKIEKPFWQSKTFWLNVAAIALTLTEQLPVEGETAVMVIGALNVLLRFITKQAVYVR